MFGILILIATVCYVSYLWDVYSYWRRKGVRGPIPLPLIGNYGPVLFQTMNESEFTEKLYKEYPNEKLIGIYRGLQPVLLVRDIELFKYFLIKDDQYFNRATDDRPTNLIKNDIIRVRSVKPLLHKQAFEGILYKRQVYDKLINYLQSTAIKKYFEHVDELAKKKTKFNVNILQFKFVVEATSAIILGMEIGTFQNNSDYEKAISSIVNGLIRKTRTKTMFATYPSLFSIFTKFAYSYTAYDKLTSIVKNVISENKNIGEDPTTIVEYLLQLQGQQFTSPLKGNILDIDYKFIVQLGVTLSFAGVDPITDVLSFMFYELAMNQNMQNKVYEEVSEVLAKHKGKLSVNALRKMKYSEMVIRETMRLHLGDFCLPRKSLVRYNIPGTNVTIDEQTTVYLLRNCVKKDPQYFINPEVFDPDRFSPTNKLKIPRMAFLPFGAGPQNCVGRYMADFIMLLLMATLLQKYRLVPCDSTPHTLQDKFYGGVGRDLSGDIVLCVEPRNGFV